MVNTGQLPVDRDVSRKILRLWMSDFLSPLNIFADTYFLNLFNLVD